MKNGYGYLCKGYPPPAFYTEEMLLSLRYEFILAMNINQHRRNETNSYGYLFNTYHQPSLKDRIMMP
jgi:hypothetical protein